MSDAGFLTQISIVVSAVFFATAVFAAGWYQGCRRTHRAFKHEIDDFNRSLDRKIAAELKVRGS